MEMFKIIYLVVNNFIIVVVKKINSNGFKVDRNIYCG